MRKLLLLAAGYVGGVLVSSLYNKKKPEELKQELEKSHNEELGELKVLWNSFVETHKNLIVDMEAEIKSEKNQKLFEAKKKEILKIASEYKKEGEKLLKELQVQGKDFMAEASESLDKTYHEKKEELESFTDICPEKIEELKANLFSIYEEIKKKIIS